MELEFCLYVYTRVLLIRQFCSRCGEHSSLRHGFLVVVVQLWHVRLGYQSSDIDIL